MPPNGRVPLHLVVPVDGSEPSNHAITWAVDFGRRTGARLSMCSVVDPMLACVGVAGGAPLDPGPMLDTLAADADRFCSAAARRANIQSVAATTVVLEGAPPESIERFAQQTRADIVVLGTHARGGIARGMLGSVAAAVARSGVAAVVTLRAQSRLAQGGPIVVATDDSAASAAAGHFAATLALALDVPIHFLHVVAEADRAAELDSLERLAAEAAGAGLACTTEIRHGATIEALLAGATERGASLIATGTHGRGAVGRLFLGSVAEGLMRDSLIPVAIVRG